MRLDHLHGHMSRRDALRLGAAGAAAATAGALLPSSPVAADGDDGEHDRHHPPKHPKPGEFTDEMFDVAAVIAGVAWPSPYGPDDQRGTFNEVTAERTAAALRRLKRGRPVNTYQLGEEMFNGFPAFPSEPPRLHDMFLYLLGYEAPPGFVEAGGIQSSATAPLGPNLVTGHEERFRENFTLQIGSQIDGIGHVGVGPRYYNDNYVPDFISPTGLTKLGNETMGPIVTRGVIIDIVGMKVAAGATDDFFIAPNGQPVLRDNYRITIDDILHALRRQRVRRGIGPGDVPILHTGWTHLVRSDPGRYLTQEPGIYLAEARYFAECRVAMVATDTWGLEVLDPAVTEGNAFPCHQELFGKTGIRIGESFVTDSAIADHAYDGVFIATPENVPGATAGSSAPAFLGQPGRAPRS
ncbi:cyclase family protein [Ilumatobacter sp.]|uniref:cyclase family protein n=1 Tax=Ilumatobacter sp. TaxID=1967498 RepID=UPI003AF73931